MSAPLDRLISPEAVEALRALSGAVIKAAVDAPVDPVTCRLAIGVIMLVIDHEARLEYEAGVVKELDNIVAEATRQAEALVSAASAQAGVTH